MTSYMTILVRVRAGQAEATLARLRAEQAGMASGIATANRAAPLGSRHITSLMKFGNQLQWTGRMLQYNFTIPILAAAAAGVTWSMQQEKAMTHVAKVYGDTEAAAKQFHKQLEEGGKSAERVARQYEDTMGKSIPQNAAKAERAMSRFAETSRMDELDSLDRAFTALSNHYGVQKKEVLEVAGAWAAAGASGVQLAESVENTMKAIVIGDMDAAAATKALISIQAQYGLSTKGLMATLATLNSVENATGANMQDLITGFEKAAGVARSAGIETRELATYMAALVPATGSAASAGNALKTIISRLMSPTKEAKQVMEAMNLEVTAMSWQSSSAAERLQIMAKEFNNLSESQKGAAASVIASRWQVNRFEVLMRELVSTSGQYQNALKATTDQGKSFTTMQKELNTVLESNPRKLQRMWVMLQNAMVEVVQPLIPFVIYLADRLAKLAQAFADMNPELQKFVLLGLVVLAAIGPIVRYMGALTTLFGVIGKGSQFAILGLALLGKILLGIIAPWTLFGKSAESGTTKANKAVTTAAAVTQTAQAKMTSSVQTNTALRISAMLKENEAAVLRQEREAFQAAQSVRRAQWEATQRANIAAAAVFQMQGIAELSQATQTEILQLGASTRIATEEAEQARRIFVADVGGTSRTSTESAEQTARVRVLAAGSSIRTAAETAEQAQRVFIVNGYAEARVVAEGAAELQRVIQVNKAGAARVSTEAAVQARLSQLVAGPSATRLAIEASEQAERVFIVTAGGEARVGVDVAEMGRRVFIVSSGGVALVEAERAAAAARITAAVAFAGGVTAVETTAAAEIFAIVSSGRLSITAEELAAYAARAAAAQAHATLMAQLEGLAVAEVLAIHISFHAEDLFLWEQYYIYLMRLRAGFNAAMRGLEAGASANRLAIEAAMHTEILAIEAGSSAKQIALIEAAAVTRNAIIVSSQTVGVGATAAGAAAQAGAVATGQAAQVTATATGQATILTMTKAFISRMIVLVAIGASAIFSPWTLAILAIVGLAYAFRKQIEQIWNNIIQYFAGTGGTITDIFNNIADGILRAFYSLPQGVQDVMIAIVTVVRDAALAVYEWFQYINPWASHSPSLVENVTTGMTEVMRQFSGLSNIQKYTRAAYAEIKRFGEMTAKLGMSASALQAKDDRKALKKAGAGGALVSYNKLQGILKKLNPILKQLEGRMNAQQAIVDRWQAKVDQANRKLDRQQDILNSLQGTLDKYQAKLSEAEASLDFYASAPLEGMQAMENQIFRNQMAQTRLRFEMMKFEDVNGTFDEIKSKLEAINGAQEILRGTQASLRAAGAGSDILGQYDKEMAKLDEQENKYKDAADTLGEMQARLDVLQRQAERLDLVKAMKFDKLQHQIDLAANRMKEMPFDEIMQGIRDANAQIDKYGPKVDAASAAVDRQQKVVDALTAARDRLQVQLDKEQAVLDRITEKYNEVNDAISAINTSIGDVVSSATKMNDALSKKKGIGADLKKKSAGAEPYISPGLQNFLDAKGAGFDIPGGPGMPSRTNWKDQSKLIDEYTQKLSEETSEAFANINPFAPLKEKTIQFWNWLKQKSVGAWRGVVDFMSAAFSGVDIGGGGKGGFLSGLLDGLKGTGKFITKVVRDIMSGVKKVWDVIGPDVKKIGSEIWKSLKRAWDKLGPLIASFGELFGPVGEALKNIWKILKPVLTLILGPFILGLKAGLSILGETIGPAIDMVVDVIAGFIKVVRGTIKIMAGIFTGDWKMVLDGFLDVFVGTFDQIWGIIKGVLKIIKGFVKGVVKFFKWLFDILIGHSIVPDLVDGILFYMGLLEVGAKIIYNVFIKPIVAAFKAFIKAIDYILPPLLDITLGTIELLIEGTKIFYRVFVAPFIEMVKFFIGIVVAQFQNLWILAKAAFMGLKRLAGWLWDNVLKPAWIVFKHVWTKWIWPFLKRWFPMLKVAWKGLQLVAKWLWNEVLKPAWNNIKKLWIVVRPELAKWWERIKSTWNALKTTAIWIWNNVLKPVWDKIKKLWTDTHAELSKWKERILRAWDTLKRLGTWIKENVMDPVFNAIKAGWNRVKDWLEDSKDLLKAPIGGIVNAVITAINTVINGLNKVADILPGFDWHISVIPHLAQGGNIPKRRVGSGFKTTGARAIVGEGKPNWPEFVIPTDPTHRKRARSLLGMAARKIGGGPDAGNVRNVDLTHGVPKYGLGGWIGDRWDDVKNIGSQVADWTRDQISKIMDPILEVARNKINDADWPPVRAVGLDALAGVQGWVRGTESLLSDLLKKYVIPKGGNVNVPAPDNPGAHVYWKGGEFTNLFVAHMKKAEELSKGSINVTQGGFRPRTSYSGTSHQGDALDMQVSYAIGRALRRVGVASGDRTGLGDWSPHIHAIPGPSAGSAAGSGPWQFSDYIARGGMKQSMTSPWGLARGGIVKARRGGVMTLLGEGMRDELVTPLPNQWRDGLLTHKPGGGDTINNFYGDLSFPNITTGDDAQTFIDNLKSIGD
jgi:TP901 family phage tail tape measure protein